MKNEGKLGKIRDLEFVGFTTDRREETMKGKMKRGCQGSKVRKHTRERRERKRKYT